MSIFRIAMDGPVAAGKGTVARLVANRLNFLYIDTGAMYRMVAYMAIENDVSFENEDELVKLIEKSTMQMRNPTEEEKDGRLTTVFLNGEDVSWKIRTEQVGQVASRVAQFPKVRAALVKQQQKIAQSQSVIMEGRDITFRVLPDAELKIFLTASDVIRAKRRFLELQSKGQDVEFESVYMDLLERDKRDTERSVDPLHVTPDAWVVDTSDLEIEKVVDMIEARVKIAQEQKAA
jgi:cytidylate kinase